MIRSTTIWIRYSIRHLIQGKAKSGDNKYYLISNYLIICEQRQSTCDHISPVLSLCLMKMVVNKKYWAYWPAIVRLPLKNCWVKLTIYEMLIFVSRISLAQQIEKRRLKLWMDKRTNKPDVSTLENRWIWRPNEKKQQWYDSNIIDFQFLVSNLKKCHSSVSWSESNYRAIRTESAICDEAFKVWYFWLSIGDNTAIIGPNPMYCYDLWQK